MYTPREIGRAKPMHMTYTGVPRIGCILRPDESQPMCKVCQERVDTNSHIFKAIAIVDFAECHVYVL